ncbi:MAG TPA: flagellar motor switch protein FliM [Acidobacteriota bacterium]|nr:flagellar motor switch protein FliM [Acidobacteriota bacterium]
MDKILSQDEINALFSAMSSAELDLQSPTPEKTAAQRKVASYDFHRADRISQDQMRSIHLLHEYFGRNFSSSLSAYLRAFVDISLLSVDQIPYSQFLKLLPDPTLFTSIGMRPLDSNMAMELNPSLVFPMIDMLLGGSGIASSVDRNPTEIEMNIIEGVIRLAMRDLREAWRPIMELEFFIDGTGTKPQMFQIVSPVETVVAVALEIKVGENAGMMNLCIPSRMLKLIRRQFDQQWSVRRHKAAGSEAERIMDLLRGASVSLSGEMRHSKVTVDELLSVAVGDVVALDQRLDDSVLLCVGGIPKFRGRIVLKRGKKAFEVHESFTS